MTNFAAAITALIEADVDFVVVGAYAAVAQGSAQITRDLNICYERGESHRSKRLSDRGKLPVAQKTWWRYLNWKLYAE
jgi:hypothetical protein